MPSRIAIALFAGLVLHADAAPPAGRADQSSLPILLNQGDRVLAFDWPAIRVGTGEYPDGPTGVTVIHFPNRAFGSVDVRGGGPGTVNTDYLRLGWANRELDAVVFSGGSWYGLESTTAVATALKDDGIRDGNWDNLSLSVGAIIYDLGDRRLNEIYPDKRLAQAALRAARPGTFPLGAQGAGRNARSGGLFGCNAYSGQGAAFRQVGELKIAAFVVVNAVGVVTRRDGRVAACYRDAGWPEDLRPSDLLANYPASRKGGWNPQAANQQATRNTTVFIVASTQMLDRAQLDRLATQVSASMARALQPYATEFDGDVLYAVSTAELDRNVDQSQTPNFDLDVLAGEVMWDAILSSVPEQPGITQPTGFPAKARVLANYEGEYLFSPIVRVRVTAEGDRLYAQASGPRKAYAIPLDKRVELLPVSATRFVIPGRYPLLVDFSVRDTLIINPGHWQQVGRR